MPRLSWNGSLEAQRQYEAASKAAFKPRPAKTPKQKKKRPKGPRGFKIKNRGRYHDYLKSKWWAKRRQEAIDKAGGKCERCGRAEYLQVHHKRYTHLWGEKDADLHVLCSDCHENMHRAKELGLTFDQVQELDAAREIAAIL